MKFEIFTRKVEKSLKFDLEEDDGTISVIIRTTDGAIGQTLITFNSDGRVTTGTLDHKYIEIFRTDKNGCITLS